MHVVNWLHITSSFYALAAYKWHHYLVYFRNLFSSASSIQPSEERENNQYKLFTKVKRAFIKNWLFHIYKNTFGCVYFQMNYYNMAVFMISIEEEIS